MLRLTPRPSRPLHLALLGAHCDDVEIGCGGMVLDLAGHGALAAADVLVVASTPIREEESRRSLAAFCAPVRPAVRFGGLPDGHLPGHWDAVKQLLQEFAAAAATADVVLAPAPADGHQDHRLLGELVATAFRDHLVLHYEIPKWDGDLGASRPQAFWPLRPELVARKYALLREHYLSQRDHDWFREDTFTALARLRGLECRTDYAEAFATRRFVLEAPCLDATGHGWRASPVE